MPWNEPDLHGNVESAEEYLTVDELAARLKVPKSWVYSRTRLQKVNGFPCHRYGKYLRFLWSEVISWCRKQSAEI